MKTQTSYTMLTSDEIKHMIDSLEGMNNEDVKDMYGIDTVEEANIRFWEEYQEAVEIESEYEGMSGYEANWFSGAYEIISMLFKLRF